jgi:hypothetical protein
LGKLGLEVLEDRMVLSTFVDGFEGPSLSALWSTTTQAGSITFPSAAQPHSGQQSLQFDSTQSQGDKRIEVFHVFPTPTFGRVSVWMYDTGADELSSNYTGMYAVSQSGEGAALFTFDYDLGPDNGGNYYGNPFGDPGINTGFDRTKGWHQLTIDTTPQSQTLAIDGNTVATGAGGVPVAEVHLFMSGPTWRPAWQVYFDDFEFEDAETSDIEMRSAQLVGNTVQFTYQTTGSTGAFQVGLYRSADGTTYNPADLIGTLQTVTPGPPGQATASSVPLPSSLASDLARPFILVVADPPGDGKPNGEVAESNESNNAISVTMWNVADSSVIIPAPVDVDMLRRLDRMAAVYYQSSGKTLLITSWLRTPEKQAALMFETLNTRNGEKEIRTIYTSSPLLEEIIAAYKSGQSDTERLAAMTATIQEQVGQQRYISFHLSGRAVDIRSQGAEGAKLKDLDDAVNSVSGVKLVNETLDSKGKKKSNEHYHLDSSFS